MDSIELLRYIQRVHERTERVIGVIPSDKFEESLGVGRFTLGDLVRHIALINRYMFIETAAGRPSRYQGHESALAHGKNLLEFQRELFNDGMRVLREIEPRIATGRCTTVEGNEMPIWKWMRAMTEHEIHHRGQIYMGLGQLGIATPPIFGMTSEQVRERSKLD